MKSGAIGWAGLAALIVTYDFWAIQTGNETLSAACWRSLENPTTRAATVITTALLVKHLLAPDFLPQIDPLKLLGRGMERVKLTR